MLNVKSVKWFFPVLLFFLMPGCSTTEKCAQKTEPSVQEAEAHVKIAPYRVRGKRYTPMSVADALQYHETGYASWFDALAAMQRQMDAADYEVAIIGAGAYGLPLAAFCARELNAQAVQMAGATQLLFGIRGKRWDDHPILSRLYNDAWVRPGDGEGIRNKDAVEGGSYW